MSNYQGPICNAPGLSVWGIPERRGLRPHCDRGATCLMGERSSAANAECRMPKAECRADANADAMRCGAGTRHAARVRVRDEYGRVLS